jgi:cyclic pyranopterin phosphate synthase
MPEENMRFMSSHKLMSAKEVIDLATIFSGLGIEKIRLTGGEPTLRPDLHEIVAGLSALNVKISITTNGATLSDHLAIFSTHGLKSINVSLDTLDAEKFKRITQRSMFEKVISNIHQAVEAGFHIKINVVIMRGFNDDEVLAPNRRPSATISSPSGRRASCPILHRTPRRSPSRRSG